MPVAPGRPQGDVVQHDTLYGNFTLAIDGLDIVIDESFVAVVEADEHGTVANARHFGKR
jgi:hypothetical protein